MAPRLSYRERRAAQEDADFQAALANSLADGVTTSPSIPSTTPPIAVNTQAVPPIDDLDSQDDLAIHTSAENTDVIIADSTVVEETAVNPTSFSPNPTSIIARPESVVGEEQEPTPTKRVIPPRLAAIKAVGSYALVQDISEAITESDAVGQNPQENSSKRKRRAARTTDSSVLTSQDAVHDDSDVQEGAVKTPVKRQKSITSRASRRMIKDGPATPIKPETTTPAVPVIDNDEMDEDFTLTTKRSKPQTTTGELKQYSLRRRKEIQLAVERIKQEPEESSEEEDLGSDEDVGMSTTTTAVRKGTRAKRSLRGKETADERKASASKALISALPDSPKELKKKKKAVRIPGAFTNNYKIRFGFTPFPKNTRPSAKQCHEVFDILKKHHEPDDIKLERYPDDKDAVSTNNTQGPMHAADEFLFHSIVKTILSQATNNENALTAEQSLIHRFRFDFLGVKVKGTSPNYHKMRKAGQTVIAKAIASAGLHNAKAKQIQQCMDRVYALNMDRATEAERVKAEQIGESADFIPGMLSLDYMNDMSIQEKFDHLVSFPGIGVKTAACILSFNFEYPVFAVDTHVLRLSRILKWLPLDTFNADHAFMHLDKRIPDELKYGLHQAFWHHGQMCIRCRAGSDEHTKGWNETACPIEHLVDRMRKDKAKKPKEEGGKLKRPKVKNQRTVFPHHALTPQKAEELGFELRSIVRDDAFGVRRANISVAPILKWVLKEEVVVEEEESEAEEE